MNKIRLTIIISALLSYPVFSQEKKFDVLREKVRQFQIQPVKNALWKDKSLIDLTIQELLGLNKKYGAISLKNCWPEDTAELRQFVASLPFLKNGDLANKKRDNLVHEYAFRKLIKKDFNSLILGNDNIAKLKRYASFDLSEDPSFSFSPFVFESDAKVKAYKNILAISVSGKLNSDNFYNLSKTRDLTLGLSWTRILQCTNYKPNERSETIRKRDTCILVQKVNNFFVKYWSEFEEICDNDCLSDSIKLEESGKLRERFLEKYSDFEIETMDKYWASKNFWWFTLKGELGRDHVSFVPATELANNIFNNQNEVIFTPSIVASINYFTQKTQTKSSFVASIWGGLKRKHSLSEILEPETFQPFHKINDSLHQQKSSEDVFVTDFNQISEKAIFDFGIRLVGMLDITGMISDRERRVGLSYSFSRNGLVNDKKFASLFRNELGIVLPFLNSDGESTFNLEIFRRWDTFSNFSNDNNKIWGARFNVPIN